MPSYDPRAFLTFLRKGILEWEQTASPVPSQRFLVNAMVEGTRPETAGAIVELGPGVGVMTEALLARMRPESRLYTIEIDAPIHEELLRHVSDPRLVPILGSAEHTGALVKEHGLEGKADAVLSSLGLSLIPDPIRHRILTSAAQVLAPHGVYVQFGYVHTKYFVYSRSRGYERFDYFGTLQRYFGRVERQAVPLNFPPAFVYVCRP
jgi:phosphatidylethanolamine/phosphatidyl-N-methylethanolamine N-methyltransferase